MNYKETIEYLYSQLPMFQRSGAAAFKPSLENTLRLCKALDDPQEQFKSIHIGGTNGKGSVSHMLAAVLQVSGYKTGLYTSPHLRDFRERIRSGGQMAPESFVVDFVQEHRQLIEEICPSFFELTVAMAFYYFAEQKVDVAVIEVGMGGRLDSTNIISPDLTVITNISMDHVQFLGDTLPKIAGEKAGIIKRDIPIIIGEHHPETAPVFIEKAKEMNADIHFASTEWRVAECTYQDESLKISLTSETSSSPQNLLLDLSGNYQQKNIKTVLSSIEKLKKMGYKLPEDKVLNALTQVKPLTGLSGRWQTLHKAPLVICDTGHNEEGIAQVVQQINVTPHHQLHMVIGMVADKEIDKVLALLPKNAIYYFCKANISRALNEHELHEKAQKYKLEGKSYPKVETAYSAALNAAHADDLIFIGGSTFVVAEAL